MSGRAKGGKRLHKGGTKGHRKKKQHHRKENITKPADTSLREQSDALADITNDCLNPSATKVYTLCQFLLILQHYFFLS